MFPLCRQRDSHLGQQGIELVGLGFGGCEMVRFVLCVPGIGVYETDA